MKNIFKKVSVSAAIALIPVYNAMAQNEQNLTNFTQTNQAIKNMGGNLIGVLFYISLIVGAIVLIPQIIKLFGDRSEDAQKGLLSSGLVVLIVIGTLGILRAVLNGNGN